MKQAYALKLCAFYCGVIRLWIDSIRLFWQRQERASWGIENFWKYPRGLALRLGQTGSKILS